MASGGIKNVSRELGSFGPYAASALLILLATLAGLPLRPFLAPANLVMIYLVAVVLAATRYGRWPSIVASLLSLIAFDAVFVPPYYTLGIADAEYLLTFAGLLAVSLVISTLAVRARAHEQTAQQRAEQTIALFELSRKLALAANQEEIGQTAVDHISTILKRPTALYLPTGASQALVLQASSAHFPTAPAVQAMAQSYFQQQTATDSLHDTTADYLLLHTASQRIGILVIAQGQSSSLGSEQHHFLTSIASQIALALEKATLAESARQTRLLEETEKLHTTLLNAISHDLRTPLAAITGALSSLLDDADLLSETARRELTQTAWEEALRLNHLVGNLLDMTRLESGSIKVVRQPCDVQDLVGATLAQMPNRLRGRLIKRRVPDDLPPVDIDFALILQALVNLVDNALKYAPPEEMVEIEASQSGQEVILAVKDRGPGIPPEELEQIFTKFFRLQTAGVGGTGLGLSIARGIVEAHNGRVWAENRPDGGAIFLMALPIWQP